MTKSDATNCMLSSFCLFSFFLFFLKLKRGYVVSHYQLVLLFTLFLYCILVNSCFGLQMSCSMAGHWILLRGCWLWRSGQLLRNKNWIQISCSDWLNTCFSSSIDPLGCSFLLTLYIFHSCGWVERGKNQDWLLSCVDKIISNKLVFSPILESMVFAITK